MSFDLYAFSPPGPATQEDVYRLLEAQEERLGNDKAAPLPTHGPEMSRFLDELVHRWPNLDDDPEGNPWNSMPPWDPIEGGGAVLNINWFQAGSVAPVVVEIAERANVIIFDPQTGQVIRPGTGRDIDWSDAGDFGSTVIELLNPGDL